MRYSDITPKESTMANLTSAHISALKQQLNQQRAGLWEEVRSELENSGNQHFRDFIGGVADTGDNSVAETLAGLNAAIVDRQVHEIRTIEEALARIEDGSYGVCSDCGTDIGFSRLEVQPAASRCIVCQTAYEKTHSGTGAPTR